jgi:hypothetical protein
MHAVFSSLSSRQRFGVQHVGLSLRTRPEWTHRSIEEQTHQDVWLERCWMAWLDDGLKNGALTVCDLHRGYGANVTSVFTELSDA